MFEKTVGELTKDYYVAVYKDELGNSKLYTTSVHGDGYVITKLEINKGEVSSYQCRKAPKSDIEKPYLEVVVQFNEEGQQIGEALIAGVTEQEFKKSAAALALLPKKDATLQDLEEGIYTEIKKIKKLKELSV